MADDFGRSGGQLVGRLRGGPAEVSPGQDVDYWYVPTEPEPVATERTINLHDYWAILLKRKWLILASVVSMLALGIGVTVLTTPIYTATATLQIDREAARVIVGQDVQPQEQFTAGEEFFQTQYGLLRSRSLAQRVAESLGLARDERFLKNMGVAPLSTDPQRRLEQVVAVLQANLDVTPVRGSRLAMIGFGSPSPELSAIVVNAFAENFISSNLERRFESSSYARDFLEQRLAQVKGRLEASERQLVAYARAQQIIDLGQGANGTDAGANQSLQQADLAALNAALASARSARIAAEQRWRQTQGTRDFGATEVLTSPTLQQLNQSRARLMAEYQEKLRIYKPEFPAMQQLQAQIDETERQLQAETANIKGLVGQNSRVAARSAYEIALNEERALQGRVNQLKSAVLDLRGRSIQYNILQREVDTNRQLYDGLLQRYKEVGVAGGVTSNNLSIVDRAQPPRVPSKPRPVLNAAIAIVLGLGLGVVLAFLLEALDQAIRRPADVEGKLGLPLLGTIPKLEKGVTPREAIGDIRSPYSEAYYSLTTALQFSTKSGLPTTLLVTSSRASEGKSSTAFAIAQNFARIGKRTLIIDADLRNPSLHKGLGVENDTGLSSLLVGGSRCWTASRPRAWRGSVRSRAGPSRPIRPSCWPAGGSDPC
jgi:uncharacterized protein involved in exopolysaccharide biosynthesis